MKSKDQQLLEEAYSKVSEGKYLDNYGRFKGKPKGRPLSPYDDSARLAAKREEQREVDGGGGTDYSDVELPAYPPKPVDIDTSKFEGKTIDYRMNQYDGFEITVDGEVMGDRDLSSFQAKYIVDLLKDVEANKNNQSLQSWYKTVK